MRMLLYKEKPLCTYSLEMMICSSLILFICQLYHHFEISQQLLSAAGIFKELQPPHSSPPYNPSSVS